MNKYSEDRKRGQADGSVPMWWSTGGYQLFVDKYQWAVNPLEQYRRIAATAAKHLMSTQWGNDAFGKFFNLLWSGWLSPSTPILANMGTDRGLPVSCSGGYIHDSIDGFYTARRETAILTKHGFGTSSYLSDIRGRGARYNGGRASGTLPVIKGFVRDMEEVAQASARRGAWAGYLSIEHPDFDEVADLILTSPDGLNIGWNITDSFIGALDAGDPESTRRYQKALKVKMITGKGYFFFVDKANRHRPESYFDNNLDIKASNLCTEIMLHSSEDYTFTCVLSSMNLAKYDEWKDTDAVFWATLFLDCVAEEFIQQGRSIPGLEKAVAFTEKGRALGLGVCGWHTLLMQRGIPFESLEAQWLNNEIFSDLESWSNSASRHLAEELGVPEWCKVTEGIPQRNSHLMAIAPTKSTALIMGGVSEGINPVPALVYTQNTSAGEIQRIDPTFLAFLKDRGYNEQRYLDEIEDNFGSCQHVTWMTDEEKLIFRNAFEIDQHVVIRHAAQRQKYIDQGQSINLFFSSDEDEEYISAVHKAAFKNEDILSLYYCYSKTGIKASEKGECLACQ